MRLLPSINKELRNEFSKNYQGTNQIQRLNLMLYFYKNFPHKNYYQYLKREKETEYFFQILFVWSNILNLSSLLLALKIAVCIRLITNIFLNFFLHLCNNFFSFRKNFFTNTLKYFYTQPTLKFRHIRFCILQKNLLPTSFLHKVFEVI